MAIAFNSQSTVNSITSDSLTFALNNTAGDFVIAAGTDRVSATSLVTGVTYGGTALVAGPRVQCPSDRIMTSWYWDNASPAPTGSNNVVVTASSSTALRWSAYSYSGVDYNDPLAGTSDTSTGTAVTTISTDITTTADNAWMFTFLKDNTGGKTITSSTGDSIRMTTDAGGQSAADTGGAITPAGANTMTLNWTGNTNVGAVAIAFKPAASSSSIASVDTVTRANIGSFMGVASANIGSINGVAD